MKSGSDGSLTGKAPECRQCGVTATQMVDVGKDEDEPPGLYTEQEAQAS